MCPTWTHWRGVGKLSKFNLNQLLNSQSKGDKKPSRYQFIMVSVFKLVPSKENFYSVKDIDEIKDSIEIIGIEQPLSIRPIEGTDLYKVIAGHKRRLASIGLVEEGKTDYEIVPCIIKEDKDEIDKKLALILTNSTARQLSDYEKAQQVKELRPLYEELKKLGRLPGRIRDELAKSLKTSSSQIQRIDSINKNLIPELEEKFRDGDIGFNTAFELSRNPEEKQREVLERQADKPITLKEAKQLKQEKPENPFKKALMRLQALYQGEISKADDAEYEKLLKRELDRISIELQGAGEG